MPERLRLPRYDHAAIGAPKVDVAAERLRVSIVDVDLRHEYADAQASVTMSVLTLQFVPIEHRQRLLKSIFDHTLPGGALILVEKVLGATASLDALMVDAHLGMKRDMAIPGRRSIASGCR
jgi:hypothetical protein